MAKRVRLGPKQTGVTDQHLTPNQSDANASKTAMPA